MDEIPDSDSKVHGANMGPIWGRQDPGGPHVGPMNFTIWDFTDDISKCIILNEMFAFWFKFHWTLFLRVHEWNYKLSTASGNITNMGNDWHGVPWLPEPMLTNLRNLSDTNVYLVSQSHLKPGMKGCSTRTMIYGLLYQIGIFRWLSARLQ